MKFKMYVVAALAVFTLPAFTAASDEITGALTLSRVIELAFANAPEVQLSNTRIAEGEAKLAGAQVRTLENPKFDLAAGPRLGNDSSVDVEVGFEVPFELGNLRDKRVALAQAGIQRERYAVGDVRRRAASAELRRRHGDEEVKVRQVQLGRGGTRGRRQPRDGIPLEPRCPSPR